MSTLKGFWVCMCMYAGEYVHVYGCKCTYNPCTPALRVRVHDCFTVAVKEKCAARNWWRCQNSNKACFFFQ